MNITRNAIPKKLDKHESNTGNTLLRSLGIMLITGMIGLASYLFFSHSKNSTPPMTSPKSMATNNAQPDYNDFILNGIFISDQYKSVMINDHFFQIGDTVKGMKIVSIAYGKVQLKNEFAQLDLVPPGNNSQE